MSPGIGSCYTKDTMMILLILLAATAAANIEIEVALECTTCVIFDNACFNATRLFDLEAPFRNTIVIHKIAILRSINFMFYSFEPYIDDEEYYKVGFVNMDNTSQAAIITGAPNLIMNFGTFDIDQANNFVYLGGSDGIYKLDVRFNTIAPYSSRGDEITSVFFKNYVYFVRYDERGVVVKKGDNFKTLLEYMPVKTFVINKNDVIVFTNNFGLYVGKGELIFRLSINAFFRGLTMDLDGEVYAWWIDGIYRIIIDKNLYKSKVVKIAHIPSIGSMAFDNGNNVIFTSDRTVYRLSPTQYNCTLN